MPHKRSVRPEDAARLQGIRDCNIAWENIRAMLLAAPTDTPDETEKKLRDQIKKMVEGLGGTLNSLGFEHTLLDSRGTKAVLRASVSISFFGCYKSGWPMDRWDRDRKAGFKLTAPRP